MTKFYYSILILLFLGYIPTFAQTPTPTANRLSEFLFKTSGQDLLKEAASSPFVLFQNTSNSASYLSNIKDNPLKENSGLVLQASKEQVREIILRNSSTLNLQIPVNAVKNVTLRLVKTSIMHKSFSVLNNRGQAVELNSNAIHYQGIIEGDANSIVAVTFFPSTNTLMGLISDKSGNRIVAKINDNSDNYVVYAQKDLRKVGIFGCFVDDKNDKVAAISKAEMANASASGSGCKTIKIYFEADNNLYIAKGGTIQATVDYITGIFNQVSTLYRNESVDMVISQIKVWDTIDPYASMTSTSTVVSAFRSNLNGVFNGDIAHFVSGRIGTLGGGIAYTIPAGICNKIDMCCVSAIETTYQIIPTYSWTVNVITHEMGHLLGSRHTHWCGWVGGAIDGCAGYIEADSSGNSCTVPGNPSGGGTIMSYCHNTSVGINFNLGFGPQPGNIIRWKLAQASCIVSNGTTDIPSGLATNGVFVYAANVTWAAVANSGGYYNVEYKPASSTTWLPGGLSYTNSKTLNGLLANTQYNWRVSSACSTPSSDGSFQTVAASIGVTNALPTTFCLNSAFSLDYYASGVINSGNTFTAQLSDASGSFASPVTIGSISSNTTGSIFCTIPSNTPAGSNYVIRVISSSPSLTSSNNSNVFSVSNVVSPSLSSFVINNVTANSFDIATSAVSNLTLYYVVVSDVSSTPSGNQILQGQASNGQPALRFGSIVIPNTGATVTKTILGLYPATGYRLFSYIANSVGCPSSILQQNPTTTGSTISYCTPILSTSGSDYINSFSISSIGLNNTSGRSTTGYEFFKDNGYSVTPGVNYPFVIKTGNEYAEYASIWIDYNKNGTFEASEMVFQNTSKAYTHTGSFTVPTNLATNGLIRMRVMVTYYNVASDPCLNTTTYGEAEDYFLNINNCTTTTTTPTNLAVANVGTTTATVSWNAVPNADFYILQFRKQGQPNWDSTKTVINTLSNLNNLSSGCVYEWKVREKCSTDSPVQNFTTAGLTINLIGTISSPLCKGTAFFLNYQVVGCINVSTNTIVAQLSDASGSFSTPKTIGYLNSPPESGSMSVFIPLNSIAGTSYKIRFVIKSGATTVVVGQESNFFAISNQAANGFVDALTQPNTSDGFKIKVKTFAPGTVYYVVLNPGATPPTAAQIKAGNAANGYRALLYGSIATQSSIDYYSVYTRGLLSGHLYDVYLTVDDNSSCSKTVIKLIGNTSGTTTSCSPNMSCDGNYQIGTFSITNTTLNITDNACAGYTNFSNSFLVTPNQNYSFTLLSPNAVLVYAGVWIDYNRNGSFEATENVYLSTNSAASHTGTLGFSNTTTGLLPIRVIVREFGIVPDGCPSGYTGEANDFYLLFPPCKADVYLNFISPFDDLPANENVTREANVIDASNFIYAQGKANYYGKDAVILSPGFTADNGSVFRAEIQPGCTYPTSLPAFLDKRP